MLLFKWPKISEKIKKGKKGKEHFYRENLSNKKAMLTMWMKDFTTYGMNNVGERKREKEYKKQ